MPGYNAVVSSTQKHDNALYRGINQVNQDNKLDQSKTTSKSPSMKLFLKNYRHLTTSGPDHFHVHDILWSNLEIDEDFI